MQSHTNFSTKLPGTFMTSPFDQPLETDSFIITSCMVYKKSNLYLFSLMKYEKLWLKFIVLAVRRLMFCESVAGVWISIYFFNLLANWDLSFFTNDFKSSLCCAGVEACKREGRKDFFVASLPSRIISNLLRRIFVIIAIWQTKKPEWRSFLIYFAITWRFSVELVNYFDFGPSLSSKLDFRGFPCRHVMKSSLLTKRPNQ